MGSPDRADATGSTRLARRTLAALVLLVIVATPAVAGAPYGSATSPIPLAGTETSALGRALAPDATRVPLRWHWLQGSLFAMPAAVPLLDDGVCVAGLSTPRASGLATAGRASVAEQDAYAAAGMEMGLGASQGLDVEERYVMLRTPSDALLLNGSSGEYWTTSVGIAIRF